MRIAATRRQIETVIAALVAVAAAIVGLSSHEQRTLGPKFVALQRIARLKNPVYLTQPPGPGSQLYVVQKGGAVRVIANDRLLRRPFLDIRRLVKAHGVRSEPGMASVAFAPDYQRSGLLYVAYTDHRDALVVAQYRRSRGDPLVADPGSGRTILRIPEPTPEHHGGLILFAPDGHLYIGTGDGGPAGDPQNAAQNTEVLLGKILRIDPTPSGYAIPADNPFVAKPGRDEIWAYGLRNPRGISFDRVTGTIAIGDVGNDRYEEIDYLPVAKARGANFGWSAFEAFAPFAGGVPRRSTVLPAIAYRHGPGCAVVGGFVVRDSHLARIRGREIFGDYVFGDYCTGRLYGFRPRAGRRVGKQRSFRFEARYLTSIGRDNSGRIYLISERGRTKKGKATLGSVYRLVPHRKEVTG
ncbi:MAG TPA: PQQ-dependent sugar dehydrogenase [Solirubrobacterales bacterium]|nr:PQQ-dependent sugar dehydrogenase [Solirubrobacterales bacterium]